MNIVKRELRDNLKSLLIWSGCITVIIAMMMTEYQAYADNPEMANVLDAMPEIMEDTNAISAENIRGDVEFRNVNFGYTSTLVLKNINLKVAQYFQQTAIWK